MCRGAVHFFRSISIDFCSTIQRISQPLATALGGFLLLAFLARYTYNPYMDANRTTTDKTDITAQIAALEAEMLGNSFWSNKDHAHKVIKEIADLKLALEGRGKFDKGDAVMTILSGAGGDDAEDFSHMLIEMYFKYFQKKGWTTYLIHENQNDHGGYRNITVEVRGKSGGANAAGDSGGKLGPYGVLKNESGVHRLVRISPFNAKQLRHTSFSLVEVIPKFEKADTEVVLKPDDLKVETARSSGPGGQNVNKRETAVRVVHIPTKLAVHVESERSQGQNKEKALEKLLAILTKALQQPKKRKASKPSKASVAARLDDKRRASLKKLNRRFNSHD